MPCKIGMHAAVPPLLIMTCQSHSLNQRFHSYASLIVWDRAWLSIVSLENAKQIPHIMQGGLHHHEKAPKGQRFQKNYLVHAGLSWSKI